MFTSISTLSILGIAILTALAVLVIYGLAVLTTQVRTRRQEARNERITRWQQNPREMARAIAARFARIRARITGKLAMARTKHDQTTAALERYEASLPQRPTWKWAMLVVLIPLTLVLLYTQTISDIASFASQGRDPQVAVVLGVALAVGLFAIPFFIRIHTNGMEAGMQRAGWFAILLFTVVILVGVAILIAGGRGEAQFANSIKSSISDIAWYEREGDTAAVKAEEQHLAELKAQQTSVVEQDRFFAGGLSLAEVVFGWLEADSLAGTWLLILRSKRRHHELAILRKNTALERHDRRVQQKIIRGATEAGVLGRLEEIGSQDQAFITAKPPTPQLTPESPVVPTESKSGAIDADPAISDEEPVGEDNGIGHSTPSTTSFDDNL